MTNSFTASEVTTDELAVPGSQNRRAFAFYATCHEYAIAVLVFVQLLKRLGIDGNTDLVVIHLPLEEWVLSKMRAMGIATVEVPPLFPMKNRYYRHCLTKLRIFQLLQYERVVYVDADSIPLKDLNHLMLMPLDGPIAAPTAYWLPQPYWTSALVVVRPSIETWQRVSRQFERAVKTSVYDMEIVNEEFGAEIETVPAGVFLLNSEWEHADRKKIFADPNDAYFKASVVHFTSLAKPWSHSTRRVTRLRPDAHPIFFELWEKWRRTRDEVCRGFLVRDFIARRRSELRRRVSNG